MWDMDVQAVGSRAVQVGGEWSDADAALPVVNIALRRSRSFLVIICLKEEGCKG
jgi:hypothetical protein